MSALTITIPKVKVTHAPMRFHYEMHMVTRWGKWQIQKQYQQFQALHQVLQGLYHQLPEFPNSGILAEWVGQSEDMATEYQEGLEEYMQETAKRKSIINCPAYAEFLSIKEHSPELLAHQPVFKSEFEVEERVNDQGKVIVDMHYDDKYMVLATGNDNPLEKFNALVANTHFPWQSDDEGEYVLPLGTVQCWLRKSQARTFRRVWARNYALETKCFVFSTATMTMAVGLSDGSVEVFRLIQKPRYLYYEMPTMVKLHDDAVLGVHLDEANMHLYSVSVGGFVGAIQAKRGIQIRTMELCSAATSLCADPTRQRLFVGLAEGNVQIIEYNHAAKLKRLHVIGTPVGGGIGRVLFDSHRQYLFAGCYETGEVVVFEVGKPGHEKLSKQIGYITSKSHIVDMGWQAQKMELMVATQQGQLFFWNTLKGEQNYMLKAFTDRRMSFARLLTEQKLLITASRGRILKFWEMPGAWREVKTEVQEERELEIRRKVDNIYKVREAVKRREVNSDDDDLKGWHWGSESSEEEGKSELEWW